MNIKVKEIFLFQIKNTGKYYLLTQKSKDNFKKKSSQKKEIYT